MLQTFRSAESCIVYYAFDILVYEGRLLRVSGRFWIAIFEGEKRIGLRNHFLSEVP